MEHLHRNDGNQHLRDVDLPRPESTTDALYHLDQGLAPTVAAVAATPTLQRLNDVSQAGAPALTCPGRSVTRYEHSLGVATLAGSLGLSVTHQVAAALHDATHAAFSHTVDYLLHDPSEATHDNRIHRLLDAPDLQGALGPDLLTDAVNIIASKPTWLRVLDRYDYTHRDLSRAGLLSPTEAPDPTALTVLASEWPYREEVAFTSTDAALRFMRLMLRAGRRLYLDPYSLHLHHELADTLHAGLCLDVITLDDILTGTDTAVLAPLRHHPRTARQLDRITTTHRDDLIADPARPPATSKMRLFVPLVVTGAHTAVSLDTLTSHAAALMDQANEACRQGQPRLKRRNQP